MDLFIIEHYQEDENVHSVKMLLTTMNKYHLWDQFQKLAVSLLKLVVSKKNSNLHENVELLVEILKYSIVDATVLQVSQFFSCVTNIINKMKDDNHNRRLLASFVILVMQRMPLNQQKLFYKEYKDIFESVNKLELKYFQPGDTNYPSGLYGVNPVERIYINTKQAEKKYRYEVIERKLVDNNNNNDIHHIGNATVDENGIQILNNDGNNFKGRLYGNLFVKEEKKEYSLYNLMNNLVIQNSTYQLYNDDERSRYVDYNLFELNEKVKLSTKGDIKIEKGDKIHFMMIINDKISHEDFMKIGGEKNYMYFIVNEDNTVNVFYKDAEDGECVYNDEIKHNKIIEIKHKFKQTISGKLKIEKFSGSIFCVKISNNHKEKEEEVIKYFWPLIVPYNLKNIINSNDNNDSNLILKKFFNKVIRYKNVNIPYFYMNDYLYAYNYSNSKDGNSHMLIRNKYPIKLKNNNEYKIMLNIQGHLETLNYLKIDGKGNNGNRMYWIEIKGQEIILNENNHYFEIFDSSDIFSFIFSYKKVNLKFRRDYDEKYSFDDINVNSEVDYYITTVINMKIKNYKVNIEGQIENKNKGIQNNVFRNGLSHCKVNISEMSPDAEFSEYNLMDKKIIYNGILEYNNNENSTDRKGKYNNYENSLIEVKENGNLCILRRKNKNESPLQLEKYNFDLPIIYMEYIDHRIGIKNSSAPGIQNACYMICAFQGLYHSNEILKLSYNNDKENHPIIKSLYKILHDLDIANFSINLTQFVEEMTNNDIFKMFTNNQQQDTEEFLTCLLQYCIDNSKQFEKLFTFKCHELSMCMDCEKKKANDSYTYNSLHCSIPRRFYPIYKIKADVLSMIYGDGKEYDDNDDGDEENDEDGDSENEIIDICFCSDEEEKPTHNDKYLTFISNEKNEEYEKNKEIIKHKKLKIGDSQLHVYYDTIHPPITKITVEENGRQDYSAQFTITNERGKTRYYKIFCECDLPIIEGGIYETEIANRFIKENKEENEKAAIESEEPYNYEYAIIDVKDSNDEDIANYKKYTNKIEQNLTTLGIGSFILQSHNNMTLEIKKEYNIYNIKSSVTYNGQSFSDEGYLVFYHKLAYYWGKSFHIIFDKGLESCDLYAFNWEEGDKLNTLEKPISQYYINSDNSLYVYFYISTPTVPAPPETPTFFKGYIGKFIDEEEDDDDTTVLVFQYNNIIYYDEKNHTIKNETLTSENCKRIIENDYNVKINKNEVIYKDILPCYRCYEISLQSMIESYLYDCSVEKRECECNKKSKKLAYSCILDSDLPQYLLFNNNSIAMNIENFIKITPTIKIRQNNKPYMIVEYAVYGFILHCGNNEGGHYTGYFRRSESKNIKKTDDDENPWYFFDDEKVEQRNWNRILMNLLFTPMTNIKMVFLSKISNSAERKCENCKGIEMIKPIGGIEDDLTLKLYNMYFPPLLKEFYDYKNDIGKRELHKEELDASIPPPMKCGCGKNYYPF